MISYESEKINKTKLREAMLKLSKRKTAFEMSSISGVPKTEIEVFIRLGEITDKNLSALDRYRIAEGVNLNLSEFIYKFGIQTDLSNDSGINKATLSNIVSGKQTRIKRSTRQQLAEGLSKLSGKTITLENLVELLGGMYNE